MNRSFQQDPDLMEHATKVMRIVMSHPCGRLFTTNQTRVDLLDLSTITGKLLMNNYQTAKEWRKDMKSIVIGTQLNFGRKSCEAKCANQMFQVFEKEYGKIPVFSCQKWGKLCDKLRQKLQKLMESAPSSVLNTAKVGLLLWNGIAASNVDAQGMKFVDAEKLAANVMFPFVCSTMKPDWIGQIAETDVIANAAVEPIWEPKKFPDPFLQAFFYLEDDSVKEKEPESEEQNAKVDAEAVPEQLVSLSQDAKPSRTRSTKRKSEGDFDNLQKRQHRVTQRQRIDSYTVPKGSLNDNDYFRFMRHASRLDAVEDVQMMAQIIIENEKKIDMTHLIPEVNLALLSEGTLRLLMEYVSLRIHERNCKS